MSIPIIDLFAGPGGLGEGFMSLKDENGRSVFDIKLSIEKDKHAHKTLTWRSFYRQFEKRGETIPEEYYEVLRESNLKKREDLIEKVFLDFLKVSFQDLEKFLIEFLNLDIQNVN